MVNEISSDAKSADVKLFFENINQHDFISQKHINHSITTIFNLPIELKQKIAMELSAKDYASFRESCLKISQDIDCFSVMKSKSTSGCRPQEYEDNIKRILLNQSVRMIMHHHEDESITKILENVCIRKLKSSDGGLFMSTIFSTRKMKVVSGNDIDNPYPYWIKKSFILFKNELSSKVVGNPKVKIIQIKNIPYRSWVVGITFKNEFICYSELKTVFIALGQAFNQASGAEKLLIAIFADELKSFWCKNIPHGLVKENIAESAREVANLFTVATEVRRTLQENIH